MLTYPQMQSIEVFDPADQEAAYNLVREHTDLMTELEIAFQKYGAKAATEMLTSIMATCDDANEYDRLSAGLLTAAYGHVLRMQRKQAN